MAGHVLACPGQGVFRVQQFCAFSNRLWGVAYPHSVPIRVLPAQAIAFARRSPSGRKRLLGFNAPLTHFEHAEPLNQILVNGFDDRQMVLVFISREANHYFRLSRTPASPVRE